MSCEADDGSGFWGCVCCFGGWFRVRVCGVGVVGVRQVAGCLVMVLAVVVFLVVCGVGVELAG